jgi:hypothetical protein
MDQVIWVEILTRHRDVTARHRLERGPIRIGRGYDNDIVLDDPHVAPSHLVISRDEDGALVAQDLGTRNGLFAEGSKAPSERVTLDGERLVRIGQTWLRVRESSYAVPPERLAVAERRLWPWAIPLIAAILGIEAADVWLAATQKLELTHFLNPMIFVTLVAVGWITVWTVISRVFAGAARFERHLVFALSVLLGYSIFDEIASLLAYGFSLPFLVTWRDVVYWAVVGAAAYGQMRIIGPGRLRLKLLGAVAIAAGGIVHHVIGVLDMRENADPPPAIHRFYPPEVRLGPTVSEDRFINDLGATHRTLDGERGDNGQ